MPIHTVSERRKNKKKAQKKSFIGNIADIAKGFQSVLPGGSKKPLGVGASAAAKAAAEAKRQEDERRRARARRKGN